MPKEKGGKCTIRKLSKMQDINTLKKNKMFPEKRS